MMTRAILLILSLSACVDNKAKSGAEGDSGSSTQTDDTDTSIDRPVSVSGSFLICAAEYQDVNITTPTFGCRLASEDARVAVPESASADIALSVNGTKVNGTTAKAPAGSYWQWIVTTTSKGPFDAELALKDVTVDTSSQTPIITAGKDKYDFEKALVKGSKLVWSSSGQTKQLTVDTDNGDDGLAQKMPTANYATTFPRHLLVSKAATPIIEIGFYLNDNSIKFCRYIRSANDPSYFIYSTVNNNCGTAPQNNPTQVTPITEPLDAIVANIKQAYIQGRTADNSDVSDGSFKATAILRPFSSQ